MRKIIPALVTGATVLAVAGGTFGYLTLDKDVQLSVDGVDGHVSTMAGTVGEVLQSKGIELGEHDVVAPAPDTRLADGTKITVEYGRQIRVIVDGQQQTYWTTATRVDDALASLDVPSEGAELSTSRSTPIGREGLSFTLDTQKKITIDNGGKRQRLVTTAQTVGAALVDAKIAMDGDDLLSVSEDTPLENGSSFSVTRVDVKKVTQKQRVKFQTRYTDDDRLEKGRTEVKTEGRTGIREIEITEVRHNGRLQSREQTKSTLTTPPRDKVVLRGTKDPAPEPQQDANDPNNDTSAGDSGGSSGDANNSTDDNANANDNANDNAKANDNADNDAGNDSADDSGNGSADNSGDNPRDSANDPNTGSGRSGSDSGNDSGPASRVWDRLAQCESGQNWRIDTGNGYYGGLQFARRSWKAYGGTKFAELASQATREQQIEIAKKIFDDVGWKAWPACSRKLGLR